VKSKLNFTGRCLRLRLILAVGVAACLLCPTMARASSIVSVQSVTAAPGSSADEIDVELTNSGPSAVTIGGFTFGISIADLDISFTDANTSTAAPYIFGADSLFGPDLTGPTSGQSLSTSDLFDIPFSGVTVGSGTTVGLGHVLFNVSPHAANGSFSVGLALFPFTSLSDESGNNVPIGVRSSGQIIITPAAQAVPEPSSLSMLLSGVAIAVIYSRRRRAVPSSIWG
jgi:hypothetical protein